MCFPSPAQPNPASCPRLLLPSRRHRAGRRTARAATGWWGWCCSARCCSPRAWPSWWPWRGARPRRCCWRSGARALRGAQLQRTGPAVLPAHRVVPAHACCAPPCMPACPAPAAPCRQDPLLARSAARYLRLVTPALWFTALFEVLKRYLLTQVRACCMHGCLYVTPSCLCSAPAGVLAAGRPLPASRPPRLPPACPPGAHPTPGRGAPANRGHTAGPGPGASLLVAPHLPPRPAPGWSSAGGGGDTGIAFRVCPRPRLCWAWALREAEAGSAVPACRGPASCLPAMRASALQPPTC